MGFVVVVTVLTSVLFGMLPSLSATRIDLAESLKGRGMRGVSGDRRRVRHGLAVAQIALAGCIADGHRASIAELCKRAVGADGVFCHHGHGECSDEFGLWRRASVAAPSSGA